MSKLIYSKELPVGSFKVFDNKPQLDNLIHVHQTHSAEIEVFSGSDISHIKSDGILIYSENIKLNNFAIKTADCIPAVIIGKKGFSVIHAGWMGVRDEILINPLLKTIDPYYCFFGPSIHKNNFEVKEDFYQHFPKDEFYSEHNKKLFYDLHGKAKNQMTSEFPGLEVEDSGECTFQKDFYNSYRRDKTTQRNWNIFSI